MVLILRIQTCEYYSGYRRQGDDGILLTQSISSLHWPHILQILVPTFSAFSVAQGYVSSDPNHRSHIEDHDASMEDADLDAVGEEAAERRRRIEEERQGRTCPVCLSKPVAARMTKCGHVSLVVNTAWSCRC